MFTIGNIRVHLICDSFAYVDPGGPFGLVPRVLWSKYKTTTDAGLVAMPNHNLLIQTGDQNIIVDTGLGQKLTDKTREIWQLDRSEYGDLVDGLSRAGVSPENVTMVIDTHLHSDHCSGNTRYDESGEVVATFPNAEYVVQRREYEDAMQPNERTRATYHPVNYQPLLESGQLRLLDGDTDLAPGVRGVVTPGHTPGHMSVIVEDGGETLLFVCDMASYAVHFERLGWMTAFDVEPLVTLETKRHWQQWALEKNALLIFPHDADRPTGRLTQTGDGKLALQTVGWNYT